MINVSGLSYILQGNILINNLSLAIKDNEILGIIGRAGSGKSTLLKILSGREKKYQGSIIVNDKNLKSYTQKSLVVTTSYFNGSVPFNKDDTVENFIQLSRLIQYGMLRPLTGNDKEAIDSYIDLFQLNNLKHTKLKYLCDSELIITLLAFAFIREAPFVFLDNPTAKIDLKSQVLLNRVINKASSIRNESIIIASNDINFITQTADRIIVLNGGEIVAEGPPEIITDDLIKKHFDVDVLLSRNIYNGKPEIHFFPVN